MPWTLECLCGARHRIKETMVGRRTRCPECDTNRRIPRLSPKPFSEKFQKIVDKDFQKGACRLPPNEADLRRLEKSLGITLPILYFELQKSAGALVVQAREEVWPAAQVGEVGPAWTLSNGLTLFGLGRDVPRDLSIRVAAREFQKESGTKLVPFLQWHATSDLYCFGQNETVWEWWWDNPDGPHPVTEPFEVLYLQQLKELARNKDKMKRKRG